MTKKLFYIIVLSLVISAQSYAQQKSRKYINVGFLTNLEKCEDCKRADTGASLRIGALSEKRLGYYGGFIFFNEYHPDYIDYDDKGYLVIGGIDLRILKEKSFEWYLKAGLALEFYVSTYKNSSRTDTEKSIKPDFGFLFNINHFNVVLAWQPSEPDHFNVGVGYTFAPK